tara:strand:+ start:277 stop:1563 length:1287 start_codon:yes stop_codon:yes gene_type:complete
MEDSLIYSGKVRNIYNFGDDYLIMCATDRVSSFDRHIGTIPGKGKLLNKMSEFWFNETKNIIKNHLIISGDNISIVHKCKPIMIEVIVRAYITGNTNTSLWTHYNNGSRVYCGITFPENLKKNQKLEKPVITPTTKGKEDIPISKEDIVSNGYMTIDECNYVFEKALELFKCGESIADKGGLILVDTKYEFGKNKNGEILLMDELHTCDSSRYWKKSNYIERFNEGKEPEKYDKDCIRDWVKSNCDPYKDDIPEIPENIIDKAYNCYEEFYNTIISTHSEDVNILQKQDESNAGYCVVILSGSDKDESHVNKITYEINNQDKDIEVISFVASAHKNTLEVLKIIDTFENKTNIYSKIIWVTVAGRSNALSGVVASNTKFPVIACPPFSDKLDMIVNIQSTLQCPSYVPVMTILEPINVAIAIKKIFLL